MNTRTWLFPLLLVVSLGGHAALVSLPGPWRWPGPGEEAPQQAIAVLVLPEEVPVVEEELPEPPVEEPPPEVIEPETLLPEVPPEPPPVEEEVAVIEEEPPPVQEKSAPRPRPTAAPAASPRPVSTPRPPAPKPAPQPRRAQVVEARPDASRNPPPRYPDSARRQGWEGRVMVRATVGADGRVQSVALHRSSGHGVLDRAALDAVRRWRFRPRTENGNPTPATVEVPVNFFLTGN
jgi:protein TonB